MASFAMGPRMGAVVLCAAVLAACSHAPSRELVRDYGHWNESPERFGVCMGYGCAEIHMTGLKPAEWAGVREIFGAPGNAAEERAAIARAVGLIERLVGPRTGSDGDRPGAAIVNFRRQGQMDCIDEAFNTTSYLRFLERDGLLRHHAVGLPVRRGSFIDRWPHNAATIMEKGIGSQAGGAGVAYVVDSWFHGNGVPPEVLPLAEWMAGWSPERALTLDDWRVAGAGETETAAGSQ